MKLINNTLCLLLLLPTFAFASDIQPMATGRIGTGTLATQFTADCTVAVSYPPSKELIYKDVSLVISYSEETRNISGTSEPFGITEENEFRLFVAFILSQESGRSSITVNQGFTLYPVGTRKLDEYNFRDAYCKVVPVQN